MIEAGALSCPPPLLSVTMTLQLRYSDQGWAETGFRSTLPLHPLMTLQERYWVETGFRSGTLLTLTATSTLAAG